MYKCERLFSLGGLIVNISADDAVAGTTRSICSAVESLSAAAELRTRPDHTGPVQRSGDHNGVNLKLLVQGTRLVARV